ncbi:MAG TPA: ATP-binding protein, partial [Acidimicrobiales bacterium]
MVAGRGDRAKTTDGGPLMPGVGTEARATFPGLPESAGQARRFVSGALAAAGRPEAADAAEVAVLLVSELVSNAVLHAGTELEVVVRILPDRLVVEVHDQGGGRAVRRRYSRLSGTGRGLVLVEELARDWGTVVTEAGKYVWFELDL